MVISELSRLIHMNQFSNEDVKKRKVRSLTVPVVFIFNVCFGQDNQNLPGHNLCKLETTPSLTTTNTS